MRSRECPREGEVALAMRRGRIDPALREHAGGCDVCAATAAVASAFATLIDEDVPGRAAVDARVLWLKAQLVPRSMPAATAAAASRGVAVVWGVVGVCWAIFIGWRWDELRQLLDAMTPEKLLMSGADPGTVPLASLAVALLMAGVTLAIMLHQVFVEEL